MKTPTGKFRWKPLNSIADAKKGTLIVVGEVQKDDLSLAENASQHTWLPFDGSSLRDCFCLQQQWQEGPDSMEPRVQIKNPKTNKYALIDKYSAEVIGHSHKPYADIPIVKEPWWQDVPIVEEEK